MAGEGTRFARRVLLVTGDTRYGDDTAAALREQRYEVRTARDGFEALVVLRGPLPDLLICELELPRMSGFELLSIVRTRFPQVAVIAVSNEYSAALPSGAIADVFIAKGNEKQFELLMAARDLIVESPLRAPTFKVDSAPVWIPRSFTGYVIITCPECLRSFSVAQPAAHTAGSQVVSCLACGAKSRYQVDPAVLVEEPLPTASAKDMVHKSKAAVSDTKETISRTKAILKRHKGKP